MMRIPVEQMDAFTLVPAFSRYITERAFRAEYGRGRNPRGPRLGASGAPGELPPRDRIRHKAIRGISGRMEHPTPSLVVAPAGRRDAHAAEAGDPFGFLTARHPHALQSASGAERRKVAHTPMVLRGATPSPTPAGGPR